MARCFIAAADLQFQPLKTLAKAGLKPEPGALTFYATLREALKQLRTLEVEAEVALVQALVAPQD